MSYCVTIRLYDTNKIQIVTEDTDYLDMMEDEFSQYVEGFQFMPRYRSGSWNGKICMINKTNYTLPYGLLFDLIKIHKQLFPRNKLIIEDDVKKLFKGTKFRPKYDLIHKPYPYQKDCVESAIQYKKGIIRSATASGKSLVISYIIKTLHEKKKSGVKRSLIVVPNTNLVEQFYKDMKEYGIRFGIGKVYQKYKEWDYDIVVSTWQTLMKNHDMLKKFDCVIIDECHSVKALELRKILTKSPAHYRFGFTGTLHASVLDNWNTRAFLGPTIRDYPSGLLAEQGYISKCNIKMLNVDYAQKEWEGEYNEVKDELFQNKYRVGLLKKIIESCDHNVLLLVGKVESEGDFLKKQLDNINRNVVFLSGRDEVELREEWREKCKKEKNIVLIATYGIFSQGLNIPNLKYLIFASPFKAKVRVLQSIGRTLRKHANKENGSTIYDIHDNIRFFNKHGLIRLRYYDSEKFDVEEATFDERSRRYDNFKW